MWYIILPFKNFTFGSKCCSYTVKRIKTYKPNTLILWLVLFSAPQKMSLKNTSLNEVLKSILTVADGKTYFDSNIIVKGSHQEKSKKGLLTRRQKEILALVAQGKSSREIAEELYIGIHTIDTHRKNMIRILGIKGKGEFLRYAIEKKYKF